MTARDTPAFPALADLGEHEGMSLRQYAAIKLRVPDSGTDWLDDMIKKSLLDEFAGKAIQGLLADPNPFEEEEGETIEQAYAETAYDYATAMLEARK